MLQVKMSKSQENRYIIIFDILLFIYCLLFNNLLYHYTVFELEYTGNTINKSNNNRLFVLKT